MTLFYGAWLWCRRTLQDNEIVIYTKSRLREMVAFKMEERKKEEEGKKPSKTIKYN